MTYAYERGVDHARLPHGLASDNPYINWTERKQAKQWLAGFSAERGHQKRKRAERVPTLDLERDALPDGARGRMGR